MNRLKIYFILKRRIKVVKRFISDISLYIDEYETQQKALQLIEKNLSRWADVAKDYKFKGLQYKIAELTLHIVFLVRQNDITVEAWREEYGK